MNNDQILDAIGTINDEAIADARAYQRPRSRRLVKWSGTAACLAVVLFTAFSVLPHYLYQQGTTPPDDFNNGIADSPDKNTYPSPNGSNVALVVNQLDAPPIMVDADVELTHYDKIPYDVWKLVEEDFYTFANISYDNFVALIPEEYRMNMAFYSLATKSYKDSQQDDAYKLHEYVFDCQSDDGGQVMIALCNFEAPIRDCFICDENPEVSNVNGTPVTIYGYDNMYMVSFSYEGVNYDIETKDMGLDQLQALLTNIVS